MDAKVVEDELEEVWDELMDGAIWEFAFDVHRAVKLNYLFLEPLLDPYAEMRKDTSPEQMEIDDVKLECPNCKDKKGHKKLVSHLTQCLSKSRKKEAQAARDDKKKSGLEASGSSGKKKPKITSGKKTNKSNAHGNSSKTALESNDVFKDMTYEEKEAFLKKKCGVLTKAFKRCSNSYKCTQHPDEEKDQVRQAHLSETGDHASNDQVNEGVDGDGSENVFT